MPPEATGTTTTSSAAASASEDDFFDLIEYLEEALRKELEDFEQQQQVNELLKYEEESLAALIAQMDVNNASTDCIEQDKS